MVNFVGQSWSSVDFTTGVHQKQVSSLNYEQTEQILPFMYLLYKLCILHTFSEHQ